MCRCRLSFAHSLRSCQSIQRPKLQPVITINLYRDLTSSKASGLLIGYVEEPWLLHLKTSTHPGWGGTLKPQQTPYKHRILLFGIIRLPSWKSWGDVRSAQLKHPFEKKKKNCSTPIFRCLSHAPQQWMALLVPLGWDISPGRRPKEKRSTNPHELRMNFSPSNP